MSGSVNVEQPAATLEDMIRITQRAPPDYTTDYYLPGHGHVYNLNADDSLLLYNNRAYLMRLTSRMPVAVKVVQILDERSLGTRIRQLFIARASDDRDYGSNGNGQVCVHQILKSLATRMREINSGANWPSEQDRSRELFAAMRAESELSNANFKKMMRNVYGVKMCLCGCGLKRRYKHLK